MMMQLGDKFGILQLSAWTVAKQWDSSHVGPVEVERAFRIPVKAARFSASSTEEHTAYHVIGSKPASR
jgi:hypothetical protein